MPSPLWNRRDFLAMAGMSWLTPVGALLADQAEKKKEPAKSVILLWLEGGPSQLETFDPHDGKKIAGGTKAIKTRAKGVSIAEGFSLLAEQMDQVSLVRSMMSKEGDHERGTYLMKTGYRPDPTIVHPTIGAICCHELPIAGAEIPRHVSILAGNWPSRGGFLGGEYDAFLVADPNGRLPDVKARTESERDLARVKDLDVIERAFARGRGRRVQETLHRQTVSSARVMMDSSQLKAFDVSNEPASVRAEYGDNPFGRGCLAARRLIEVGVRCVEVTLTGWDTHVNNHQFVANLLKTLDPAYAALLKDLKARQLLDRTVVICAGEFGRTPTINLGGGRDHWTNGYSLALAGGGIRGGAVVGETDPEGAKDPKAPTTVEDVHATVLIALGIKPSKEMIAPVTERPIKFSEGKAIQTLLKNS